MGPRGRRIRNVELAIITAMLIALVLAGIIGLCVIANAAAWTPKAGGPRTSVAR
jgi:amino acid permease